MTLPLAITDPEAHARSFLPGSGGNGILMKAPPPGASVFENSTPVDELTGKTSNAQEQKAAVEKLNNAVKEFNHPDQETEEGAKREYPVKFPNVISFATFKKDIKNLAVQCGIDEGDALLLAAEELGVSDLLDLQHTRAAEIATLKAAWNKNTPPPQNAPFPLIMGDEGNFKGFLADVARLAQKANILEADVMPRALLDLGIPGWSALQLTRPVAFSQLQKLWIPPIDQAAANKAEESSDPLNETPQQKVARKLNEAFPEQDKEWKTSFFQRKTGFMSVGSAISAKGESIFFSELDQAILDEQNAQAAFKAIVGEEDGPEPGSISPVKPPVEQEKSVQTHNPPTEPPAPAEIVINEPPSAVVPVRPNQAPRMEIARSADSAPIARRSLDLNSLGLPKHEDLEELFQWANFVAKSKFFKGVDSPEKAMVLFWMGISLGETAMSALNGYDVITDKDGNCQLYPKAKYLKARADKSGLLSRFDIIQEPTKCTVYIQRKDRPTYNTYTYTLEDAEKQGLLERWKNDGKLGDLKKKAWNNPKRMCMNRCVHQAVSTECPQVLYDLPPLLLDEEDAEGAA